MINARVQRPFKLYMKSETVHSLWTDCQQFECFFCENPTIENIYRQENTYTENILMGCSYRYGTLSHILNGKGKIYIYNVIREREKKKEN